MTKITNNHTGKLALGPGVSLAAGQSRDFTDDEIGAMNQKQLKAWTASKTITVTGADKPKAAEKPKAATAED